MLEMNRMMTATQHCSATIVHCFLVLVLVLPQHQLQVLDAQKDSCVVKMGCVVTHACPLQGALFPRRTTV